MNTFLNSEWLSDIYATTIYIVVAFLLFYIGKIVYQLFHRNINVKDELVIQDNFAFAIAHTGYFIGLLLAIGSTIIGGSNGLLADIVDMLTYGLLAILLLNLSTIFNDKLILNTFSVRKEIIEDRNEGTGVIEAASAVAAGIVLFGAISGESSAPIIAIFDGSLGENEASPLFGLTTAIAFWAIGQIVMLLTTKLYNVITPYNVHTEIEKDNVAVGVGFAGAMVSIAILIGHGLSGDFLGWIDSFQKIGIEIVIGIVLLPAARFIADKILLPGQNLTDELVHQEKPNVGAGLIEAFAYIGGAILITWCI